MRVRSSCYCLIIGGGIDLFQIVLSFGRDVVVDFMIVFDIGWSRMIGCENVWYYSVEKEIDFYFI